MTLAIKGKTDYITGCVSMWYLCLEIGVDGETLPTVGGQSCFAKAECLSAANALSREADRLRDQMFATFRFSVSVAFTLSENASHPFAEAQP
jgi:hypothetical protein